MGNSNKRKDETLGMPHGTANNRLRKNILFHLLRKYGEDICFKCDEQIEMIEDLSIEHKKPWEGISAELFWDIENIAFSHLRCNVPHRNNGGASRRISAPKGSAWCCGHKDFLPVEKFYKKGTRWNGFQINCKECHDLKRGRLVHSGERRTCNAEASGAEPELSTIRD